MKEILSIAPPSYEYHINLLEDEIATCNTVEKFSALLSKQPIKITQNHVLDSEFEFYSNGVAAAYGTGNVWNISSLAPIFSFRGPKLKNVKLFYIIMAQKE